MPVPKAGSPDLSINWVQAGMGSHMSKKLHPQTLGEKYQGDPQNPMQAKGVNEFSDVMFFKQRGTMMIVRCNAVPSPCISTMMFIQHKPSTHTAPFFLSLVFHPLILHLGYSLVSHPLLLYLGFHPWCCAWNKRRLRPCTSTLPPLPEPCPQLRHKLRLQGDQAP